MSASYDPDEFSSLVSEGRFASYQRAAGGDPDKAVALYRWSVELSAACFEAFHYVEVAVRNAIDREMRVYVSEDRCGIPWFLMPVIGKHQARFDDDVERVRRRLRDQGRGRETRDQVVAGMEFGFWTNLLHSDHEELWRHAIHKAFPHSSGKRKDVVSVLEALRIFRNRLAHHDSLLADDVRFRLSQMLDVIGWINLGARQWLTGVERISSVYTARPLARRDTVIVAARNAWYLYQQISAYVCQAGRTFQPVDHMAFYADHEIKREVPRIIRRVDNVDWTPAEVKRLSASSDPTDQRLADIISGSRALGWTAGRLQAFDLTQPGAPAHVTLPRAIPHTLRGRGSAFTQRQRYAVCHTLTQASSTQDLE